MTPSYTSPALQKNSQEDLHALERWEADWLMDFHPDKYSVIRIIRKKTTHRYPYTVHGEILVEETNTRYVGVTIADMMWSTHFEQTAAKGNKVGFLKRNLKVNNLHVDIKSLAYKTLVRPTLEYCSMI